MIIEYKEICEAWEDYVKKNKFLGRQIWLNIGFHPCFFMEINNIIIFNF